MLRAVISKAKPKPAACRQLLTPRANVRVLNRSVHLKPQKEESWLDQWLNLPRGFGKFDRTGKSSEGGTKASESAVKEGAAKEAPPNTSERPSGTSAENAGKRSGESADGFSASAKKSNDAGASTKKSNNRGSGGGGGGMPPEEPPFIQLALWVLIGASLLVGGLDMFGPSDGKKEISFQEFQVNLLEKGLVERIVVVDKTRARIYVRKEALAKSPPTGDFNTFDSSGSSMKGGYEEPTLNADAQAKDDLVARGNMQRLGRPAGVPEFSIVIGNIEIFERKLEDAQLALNIKPRDFVPLMYISDNGLQKELTKMLPSLLSTLLLIGVVGYGLKSASGGLGGANSIFNINKNPAKRITKEMVNTTFADVAGAKEAKREIMEFVEFLKDAKKFTALGAKIPRGAMLSGPPGTGKTLLARATAGEANVPFFAASGSDFVEMYVGLGASRVRELFKEARANAPCIIFIDEIDAIGRKRSGGGSRGNDEKEGTLNQLLVEMDGFDSNASVIVLAGTNRVDVLDPALIRPGRFDRQITVEKPDIEARKDIFNIHLKKIVVTGDKDKYASRLASLTPGFAGADIANICNEAAIIAARKDKKAVEMEDFEAATDRVIGGLQSHKLISPAEKKVIAYHEAGHAVAGWFLEHADPLLKVTIVPRSSGALGFAQYLPKEIFLRTKDQIIDIVCMALAGRASEQINFGNVTTGASDDLRRVTNIVYQMVQVYGMNDRIGQVAFPREEGQYERVYSENTAEIMDSEVKSIVDTAYERTLQLMRDKSDQVRAVAELLLEKETITNQDMVRLIGKRPFGSGKEYENYVDVSWETQQEKEGKPADDEAIAIPTSPATTATAAT